MCDLRYPIPTLRIALHGYARTGKDTVGAMLVNKGLTRVAMGDIIKADLDGLVQQHLGFSAFTQDDVQKKRIREVLVHWGYANYESVERRFFDNLPERAVNTRIFRVRECERWVQLGGVVWEVWRPGFGPAEAKEAEELDACRRAGLIARQITNDGDLSALAEEVDRAWQDLLDSRLDDHA
jgi:dephospho-CoA kinase